MFGRLLLTAPVSGLALHGLAEVAPAIGLLFLIMAAALSVTAIFGRR